ncbi:MAG: hypothetical protein FWG02_01235 [Holophagaceae bacterium]|nr:hypothetical protein [Holophagaceae bacterium]
MLLKLQKPLFPITALVAILVASTGCTLHRANKAFDEGKYEEAARAYSRVIQQSPSNTKAKMGYRRSATLASEMHLLNAKDAEREGNLDAVQEEVLMALKFDPTNSFALEWLAAIEEAKAELLENPDEDLKSIRDRVESESVIRLATTEPILKQFRINNQPIKDVFGVLEKHFGISFIFHGGFDSQSGGQGVTFKMEDAPLERILDTLALQNDLFYRYIDTKTVMVFKGGSNAAQRAELENQQFKPIYLDNAKPQDINATLRALIGAGTAQRIQLTPDNRLNAIIVKGRPSDIKFITYLVQRLDKAKAEVMVYIELLEVTENSMEQYGLMPIMQIGGDGIYKIGATIDNSGGPNINKGGIRISKNDIRYLFPNIQLDALKTSGEAKMTATQTMRILSDASADFNFGDKVSRLTGVGGYGNQSNTNQIPNQYNPYGNMPMNNYSDTEVGVKATIVPRVHHNGEITLDIKAEVSNLKPGNDPDRPDIGQRRLTTEVRAQNGETIIFGGLLREDEVKSKRGVWGIHDIPLLGKMLGNNKKESSRTNVLLTIRPVIVRRPDLREADFRAFDPDFTALLEEMEAEEKLKRQAEAREKVRLEAEALAAAEAKKQAEAEALAEAQRKQAEPTSGTPPDSKDTKPEPVPNAVRPTPVVPEKTEIADEVPPPRQPASSELVFFLMPITSQLSVGDRHQINMMVSGGKGVTSGELAFRIDPKLKIHSISGSDFLSMDGGTLTFEPQQDGLVMVKFKKETAKTDSGILLRIDLEAIDKGNAAIYVDGYKCFVGENPISAQINNAMVEID